MVIILEETSNEVGCDGRSMHSYVMMHSPIGAYLGAERNNACGGSDYSNTIQKEKAA
jgi:hypothetical protein